MSKIAIIWDVDGVIVDSPHEEAWRATARMEPWNVEVTTDFYLKYVASRPRYEGGNNILSLLGVYDKLGAKTEEERRKILEEFCTKKNNMIVELIERGEFKLFKDAITLVLKARKMKIPQAAASASKNANRMLRKIDKSRILREMGEEMGDLADILEGKTLYDIFDVNACGLDLGGKKNIQKYAADKLKEIFGEIDKFVVVEDAPSGIKAAKELGFYAVGIHRIGSKEELIEAGADIVLDDLRKFPLENPPF